MTYQERYNRAEQDFIDAGAEGTFRAPVRTAEELAARDITIEESIACELLRRDTQEFGMYDWVGEYVGPVLADRDYVNALPLSFIDRVERVADRDSRNISLAYLWLTKAIVSHRLSAPASGTTQETTLGFGISVRTSLAAAIVDYHRRMLHSAGRWIQDKREGIMYIVKDTFNGGVVSRHHTLERAVEAEQRYARAIARQGGSPHVSVFDGHGDMASQDHPFNREYESAQEE